MWNTLKYTFIALTREKQVLIWVVIFPIVLATLFFAMFSNLGSSYELSLVPTAVVKDANFSAAAGFGKLITQLSAKGANHLLDTKSVATVSEAKKLLSTGKVDGYLVVNAQGMPEVFLDASSGLDTGGASQTVLKSIVDNYVRATSTLKTIGEKNPAALRDPALTGPLFSQKDLTEPLQITAHKTDPAVRYYYALFGFLVLTAANIALIAIVNAQPNLSALGARRAAAGISRLKTLLATCIASWGLALICLLISFVYLRFILGVSFGGNDLACVLAFAIAALMATAFGMLIGVIPRLGAVAKGGILTGITCMLSLFAGLYGPPSVALADKLTRSAPVVQLINPVYQVSKLFYSLYYYDGYAHFFRGVGVLLIMGAVFFAGALFLIRRHRYESV